MSDNFKNSVDKFDSGELTGMKEEEIVKKIATGATKLGEQELRKQLEVLQKAYESSNTSKKNSTKWIYGIAASMLIGLTTYLMIDRDQQQNTPELQIYSSPKYGDSAIYEEDSTQISMETDTLAIEIMDD